MLFCLTLLYFFISSSFLLLIIFCWFGIHLEKIGFLLFNNLGGVLIMMFICFKFAESHRSVSFAMAKSSFKLEHPLGSLKISIFSYKINLLITIFLIVYPYACFG